MDLGDLDIMWLELYYSDSILQTISKKTFISSLSVENVKKYEKQTKHNIRYEIRFSGILEDFN